MTLQPPKIVTFAEFDSADNTPTLGERQIACAHWIYDNLEILRQHLIALIDARWSTLSEGQALSAEEKDHVSRLFHGYHPTSSASSHIQGVFEQVDLAAAESAIPGHVANKVTHDARVTPSAFYFAGDDIKAGVSMTGKALPNAEAFVDSCYEIGKIDITERQQLIDLIQNLYLTVEHGVFTSDAESLNTIIAHAAKNVGKKEFSPPFVSFTLLQDDVPCALLFKEILYALANNAFDPRKGAASKVDVLFASSALGVTMTVENNGKKIDDEEVLDQLRDGKRVKNTETSGVRMMQFKRQVESLVGNGGYRGSMKIAQNKTGEFIWDVFIPHGAHYPEESAE